MAERLDRLSALLELVRWQGRGLRGDWAAGRGLLEACYTAAEVGVPEDFIISGLCVLEAASEKIGASAAVAAADLPQHAARRDELAKTNLDELIKIQKRLADVRLEASDVLLLGDSAVLLGLYHALGAFRAQTWTVGIPGSGRDAEDTVTEKAIMALPFEVRFGWLGRLEARLPTQSRMVAAGGVSWRVPSNELQTVLLAARVGEPQASPASGTWAHLTVALKGMRDTLDLELMMKLADELELADRAHRGLALVCSMFPELARFIPPQRLAIPAWERMALRVAANRILKMAAEEE